MQTSQISKKPQGSAQPAVKAPVKQIVPEAQIESFVYRAVEARAAALAVPAIRQEMHKGVHAAYVACWAALFGIFALTFAGSPYTMYMIAVAALNGVMFFGVPTVLSRVGPKKPSAPTLLDFLRGEFDTITGPVSGMEVLIQVITVPLALSFGAVAIAFIVQASKITY